jgi:hypothetical protein
LSASRTNPFTPGQTAPGLHCIGGWVGSRNSLDPWENPVLNKLILEHL